MSKAILICGKICSGKSTLARKIKSQQNAVILSCDELMLSIFDEQLGEKHDQTVKKVKQYLMKKSLEILESGVDVILEWGFWTKADRLEINKFYNSNGFDTQWYFTNISDEQWHEFILKRNAERDENSYFIDDELLKKFNSVFENPELD